MKYYAVYYALVVKELGEMRLPEPYIYYDESIPQLVENLAPILQELHLTIVSIRPATDDEIRRYLLDQDPEDYEGYEEFFEELIAEVEGQ